MNRSHVVGLLVGSVAAMGGSLFGQYVTRERAQAEAQPVANMRCKPVREADGNRSDIGQRCENAEVVCYAAPGALSCHFKEPTETGSVTVDPDGRITITPDSKTQPQFVDPANTPDHIGI